MKRNMLVTAAVAGILACVGGQYFAAAQTHTHEGNSFTPDTIPWVPAPPVVRPGAQFAVLEGDPTASTGDFTIRLKMPDGFRIAPQERAHRDAMQIRFA